MNIDYINKRIKNEICYKTISELTDEKMMEDYKVSKSVNNKINIFKNNLEKYYTDVDKNNNLVDDIIIDFLIPPGTKGVKKGLKFNSIVKRFIIELNLDENIFEICFEKKYHLKEISETPDWYILNKNTGTIIIGMNQIDLWSGGHQYNRSSKYIGDKYHNDKNCKLLCVVCNYIYIKSCKNKIFKLFEKGFEGDTICYLNGLENIIRTFFNI